MSPQIFFWYFSHYCQTYSGQSFKKIKQVMVILQFFIVFTVDKFMSKTFKEF